MSAKAILCWLPFLILLVITGCKWYSTLLLVTHMRKAPATVVDIIVFHKPNSTTSNFTRLYEFTLPSGEKVQALDYVGGPGGPGVGEKTSIYYDTRLKYPRVYHKQFLPQADSPRVYGSLWKIFLLPVFLTASSIMVALLTIVFTRQGAK